MQFHTPGCSLLHRTTSVFLYHQNLKTGTGFVFFVFVICMHAFVIQPFGCNIINKVELKIAILTYEVIHGLAPG